MGRSQANGKETNAGDPLASLSGVPREGGRYSQSLGHGLAILASFSAEDPTLGIADLAGRLNMSRSTTHRYATTLVELGFLEQNSSRRYRLTSRAADLGLALLNSMSLRERARPFLEDLRSQTTRTVSLGILDGNELLLVDRLRGWRGLHEIDLRVGPGAHLPLYCTAMGKVLLASLSDPEQAEMLASLILKRRGPGSVGGKRALRAELVRVREAGFAIDDEELVAGLRAIAVPVFDADGATLAAVEVAVSLNGPGAAELGREELDPLLGPPLKKTARRISATLLRRVA